MQRHLVLIAPLLLAACDAGPEWRNQQEQLANELNPPEPEEPTSPAADVNDVNAAAPTENEANEVSPVENEAEAPPQG